MLFITGMPRSGTSLMSNILTKMGCDFLCNNDSIDNLFPSYLNTDGFFQRKDVYMMTYKLGLNDFNKNLNPRIIKKEFNDILKRTISKKITGIKDPYILKMLPYISNHISVVIIMIRNPSNVIASINNFYKVLNVKNTKYSYNTWSEYYTYFISISSKFRYIIVNYDDLITDTENTYNKFYSDITTVYKNLTKIDVTDLINKMPNKMPHKIFIPSNINYIYYLFLSNTLNTYNSMYKNIKPNDKCYCNSNKKYKNCCNIN